MSIRKLHATLESHAAARPVLEYALEHGVEEIVIEDVDAIASSPTRKSRAIQALREVESATHIGRLIIGRRGGRTRFELTVPLAELEQWINRAPAEKTRRGRRTADSASEPIEAQSEAAPLALPAAAPFTLPAAGPDNEAVEVYTHRLRLRSDFEVSLALPTDLTADEARRMCLWLEALPIDAPPFDFGYDDGDDILF
jgi:hypothetical protein